MTAKTMTQYAVTWRKKITHYVQRARL